ncbi:hypothetical protein GCG54_00010063 [Colletotrichum gloeosporioides]|uniref:Uncharacterized protein n=1 Tax=Colletotrichum gloeosporioides TaxID=474922 RepID=A0A8H4C9K6_COLGL|nr:uncharacterized protein GCG54_00010063 [Colletotrichum gloeosporioides]KAF3799870.1 hypothetical protein GCG54_00010063 [Colletotrichum gloeosporioides]
MVDNKKWLQAKEGWSQGLARDPPRPGRPEGKRHTRKKSEPFSRAQVHFHTPPQPITVSECRALACLKPMPRFSQPQGPSAAAPETEKNREMPSKGASWGQHHNSSVPEN